MTRGQGEVVRHQGVVTPSDASRRPYLYLPVDVPDGTSRLQTTLRYASGNVIDLGVFDSRAQPFPSAEGFRGWSGGARDRFFVATDDATPGYLPGPMPAGRWHVVLGLYSIRPEGCSFEVEVVLDDSPRPTIETGAQHPAYPAAPGWYPSDLQSHTHHSDAAGSLSDLVNAARQRGLRVLAVTDHNTVSHHRHLAEASSSDLFLLPGEEVTTDSGHANVWGARDWVDFRITSPKDVDAMVGRAHALQGLVSINHPKPGGPEWRYHVPESIDCVEAWQAAWPAGNDDSLEFYDRLLREGRRLVLVGGSDRHQPGWPDTDPEFLQVGSPTTWLWLEEFSVRSCLDALGSGRVFVSEGPGGPRLELSSNSVQMGGAVQVSPGAASLPLRVQVDGADASRLRLVGASGELLSEGVSAGTNDLEREIDLGRAGAFVRAELWHIEEDRVIALSNPLFLERSPA